jgi:hypothetical protein
MAGCRSHCAADSGPDRPDVWLIQWPRLSPNRGINPGHRTISLFPSEIAAA